MSQKVRQVLKSVTHTLGNRAYRKKQKKNPSAFFTLQQLCEKVGLDTNGFDASVQSKLDRTVSYICRYGDRFTENCICVQLYEDADDVMKQAMAEGALVCVTDHPIDGVPCILVEAPAVTYADLCSVYRDMSVVKTTVIAGSIGKTTTKKMIEAVYSQDFHTLCDAGNDNILDSVGSICQHIPASAQHYIAELSEDTPGLISQMSKIAKPDIAVFTAIDKSHIEFYGSAENILNEFRSVTKYMRPNGVCIMSLDEENTADLIRDRKVVFVSVKSQEADFFASDITVDNEGLHFTVSEKATGNTYPIVLHNVYAVHNVTTALLAFAAGVVSGVSYNHIQGGLAAYRTTGIRQNIYRSGNTVVYADCYNAVAKSIRSAVQAADRIPINGRRIAVLGDVAEAGDYTASTHTEIVDIVNQSEFSALFTCGEELKKALSGYGLRADLSVFTFDSQKDMNKALKAYVKNGDLVLFKASHSGNLKASIAAVFPRAYYREAVKYYIPRIQWHFKVILN